MWPLRLCMGICLLSLCLLFCTGSRSWAAKAAQWSGYLVDKSCQASIEGVEQPLSFVRAQTRECALMPSCRKSGYSIYSNGKFLKLDKNGNKIAEKYLRSCKRSQAFYVLVEGSLEGTTINVTRLTELDEPGPVGN